jgi:hypothetical protein
MRTHAKRFSPPLRPVRRIFLTGDIRHFGRITGSDTGDARSSAGLHDLCGLTIFAGHGLRGLAPSSVEDRDSRRHPSRWVLLGVSGDIHENFDRLDGMLTGKDASPSREPWGVRPDCPTCSA